MNNIIKDIPLYKLLNIKSIYTLEKEDEVIEMKKIEVKSVIEVKPIIENKPIEIKKEVKPIEIKKEIKPIEIKKETENKEITQIKPNKPESDEELQDLEDFLDDIL